MKYKYFLSLIVIIFSLTSCVRDTPEPMVTNTKAPGKVSNIEVKNSAGTAEITYTLPPDEDLLYVKAEYALPNGRKREVKASFYTNTMVLDGFAMEKDYEVKIYAVNKSEVHSDPVTITVHPLESPIYNVFRNLQLLPDFGGVKVLAPNPEKYDLAIIVMIDSSGKWVEMPGIYTSAANINKTLRGLDSLNRKFAITVRDRWLNYTDTLVKSIKPWHEIAVPKSRYSPVFLPGDTPNDTEWANGTAISRLWDGEREQWWSVMATPKNYPDDNGIYFTFKIDKPRNLSRIVIWDYPEQFKPNQLWYYRGNPRYFEIWGSNNPDADGGWKNWYLLGSFEQIKPSGLPYGELTTEDRQAAEAGFNYDFNTAVPKTEYIRIKNIQNWMGTTWMSLTEIQLYGSE